MGWRFMTPSSLYQSEIYKAVVKSMKYHLARAIRMPVQSFEQQSTLLTHIVAILNSLPYIR